MHYLDSHIHLQDYKTQEVKNVVNNAAKSFVTRFINLSSHPNDWNNVKNLTSAYPQIIPAFGVHPWYITDISNDWKEKLEDLLNKTEQAMVGECGIDRLKNSDTAIQTDILQVHINLANKYNRPLIIHSVKANREFEKLFSILPERTVFHSFTGSVEWGKELQKHGFFIGINFSILRKKNADEILRNLSFKRVLLETDGPYQNNISGEETLPQNLPYLAAEIAKTAGIPFDEFSDILSRNQQEFLGE
ncbi:MAG: TatD family hydrolase [Alphaproteobacteria bacterium]|nr:TatD family hydrolase [Alphaproteobacteria bacterium]